MMSGHMVPSIRAEVGDTWICSRLVLETAFGRIFSFYPAYSAHRKWKNITYMKSENMWNIACVIKKICIFAV